MDAPTVTPRKFTHEELYPHDKGPWMTLNEVAYIEGLLTKDKTVFEWGTGGSTRWFADRVGKLIAVERAGSWAQRIRREVGRMKHVDYMHLPGEGGYTQEIQNHRPDIILIDGDWRTECARQVSLLGIHDPTWKPVIMVHDYGFLPGVGTPCHDFMGAEKYLDHVKQIDSLAVFNMRAQ